MADMVGVSLIAVDSEHETVTFSMDIFLTWKEPALIVDTSDDENEGSFANMELYVKDLVWTPDLWIEDLQSFKEINVLNPMSGIGVETKTSSITLFSSVIAKIRCRMKFNDFPFDEQDCKFIIVSTNHNLNEMTFSSQLTPTGAEPGFKSYKVTISHLSEEDKIITYQTGHNFSAAGFSVHLIHQPESYILRYFLPSSAMTVVSWVSFVIPPEAIPGRTGLLVTLFLVLTTMFTGIQVKQDLSGFTLMVDKNPISIPLTTVVRFVGLVSSFRGDP